MLTQDQFQRICEFVKDKPIEVVYLFGSQATGEARPNSDYDFGVLYKDSLEDLERSKNNLVLMEFLERMLKVKKVDVIDLKRAYLRFKYEIIKNRKEIYVADKQHRDNFEYEVLRDYLDEMYFMKQTTGDYLKYFSNP